LLELVISPLHMLKNREFHHHHPQPPHNACCYGVSYDVCVCVCCNLWTFYHTNQKKGMDFSYLNLNAFHDWHGSEGKQLKINNKAIFYAVPLMKTQAFLVFIHIISRSSIEYELYKVMKRNVPESI